MRKSFCTSVCVRESRPVSPLDKVQERLSGTAAGSHADRASDCSRQGDDTAADRVLNVPTLGSASCRFKGKLKAKQAKITIAGSRTPGFCSYFYLKILHFRKKSLPDMMSTYWGIQAQISKKGV